MNENAILQLFPKVWTLEISKKAFRISGSVSGSRLKAVLGYPYPVSNSPEIITIRFAGWISSRIVSFQPDKDIQKLLSNGNRIRIRLCKTLLSIFRGFRLLEKVAHCTIINLLSSEASFQPSAPWLRVCLWCEFWTVELCQVCQHESVPGVAR